MEVLIKTVLLCFQRASLPMRWTRAETLGNKICERPDFGSLVLNAEVWF